MRVQSLFLSLLKRRRETSRRPPATEVYLYCTYTHDVDDLVKADGVDADTAQTGVADIRRYGYRRGGVRGPVADRAAVTTRVVNATYCEARGSITDGTWAVVIPILGRRRPTGRPWGSRSATVTVSRVPGSAPRDPGRSAPLLGLWRPRWPRCRPARHSALAKGQAVIVRLVVRRIRDLQPGRPSCLPPGAAKPSHPLPVRDDPGKGAAPRSRRGWTGLRRPSRRSLAQLPSDSFPANATWLALAAITVTLLRGTRAPGRPHLR